MPLFFPEKKSIKFFSQVHFYFTVFFNTALPSTLFPAENSSTAHFVTFSSLALWSPTCTGRPSSWPIMFLQSCSDCWRLSSPVSQSLTPPPMSTVTKPTLPSGASRASASEILESQDVYGERDFELKNKN